MRSQTALLTLFFTSLIAVAGGAHEPAVGRKTLNSQGKLLPDKGAVDAKHPDHKPALPPLPPGMTELRFSEFYRQPIGPRGLEFTEKLKKLEGQRVRILGYMVRQEQAPARSFLLTPLPVTLHEDEYGFCEDMPATVLHVFVEAADPKKVPFTPGLLLLSGTLSVGNRVEPDGRISTVRLQLDAPTPGPGRGMLDNTRQETD